MVGTNWEEEKSSKKCFHTWNLIQTELELGFECRPNNMDLNNLLVQNIPTLQNLSWILGGLRIIFYPFAPPWKATNTINCIHVEPMAELVQTLKKSIYF
jgi:hypothetical protein